MSEPNKIKDLDKLLKSGLSDKEVEESIKQYGTNQLGGKEKESVWSMLFNAFKDYSVLVLCGALAIKIVIALLALAFPVLGEGNDVIEVIAVIIAITLATGVSTLSEYKNRSRSDALQEEYGKTFAKVRRNNKIIVIPTAEITKNDVVLIQAGDKVPVDGILISGDIKVSQAALNGENEDEKKTCTDNLNEAEATDTKVKVKVFMGSVVTSGEAYILATVIGDATELGKINKSLNDKESEERKDTSSLKIGVLVGQIGKVGTLCAIVAAILQVVLSIVRAQEQVTAPFVVITTLGAIMYGASILIMAIPEGLAMINSLVQSMNTESLYKKNILVSHKSAFSDSAYMDMLFSDKTGTISQGVLSLVEFIRGNGKVVESITSTEFMEAITLNNLAKVSEGKAIGSNNMDRALLTYALEHGYTENNNNIENVKEVSGFNSEKKCATVEMNDGTILWKGATESILNKLTHYIDDNGKLEKFTSKNKEEVKVSMINEAKRTMKLLSVVKIDGNKTILLAILCLRDNVRPDAIETVEVLNKAGIQVVMVTGDMEETAIAIAKESGILTDENTDIVLTHEELDKLSDEELKQKLPNLRVVSRAQPLDKKRLVSVAQSLERVVGMTGDGVNDAPALKKADVGFAMGDGTAVAQEAGDVIILNNSLTSIKDCILNSRTMAKSVSKFLIFQLTVNVSTMIMTILAPILGWIQPFSVVQILWINIIMDALAALAYGGEPILNRYMNEKPVKRKAKIITTYTKSAICTSAIFITVGSIVILENMFGILDFVRPENCTNIGVYDRTFMFAFFIYSVIFNSLNTRSEKLNLFEHISQNKRFIYIMIGIFILQTVLIQIGGRWFSTTPLTTRALVLAAVLAIFIIPIDMIRKIIISNK